MQPVLVKRIELPIASVDLDKQLFAKAVNRANPDLSDLRRRPANLR